MVQDAFRRFNARLAPSGAPHTLVTIVRCVPHPCAQRESVSLPRLGSGRRVTLVMAGSSAFSACELSHDKMLVPDFCNQHVLHALVEAFDSRAWGFRRHRPTPRAVTRSFRRVTLTHGRHRTALQHRFLSVATLRTRTAPGRCAFDDAHRASGLLPTIPSFPKEPRTAPGGAPVPRRYRPRVRLSCKHLCHSLSRRCAGQAGAISATGHSARPLVKGERSNEGPRMTSAYECPHERRSRGDSFGPATDLTA